MKDAARTLAFIARFAVLGLALAFVIGMLAPGSGGFLRGRLRALVASPTPAVPATEGYGSGPVSYADAVAKAAPSVINIYANKMVTEQPRRTYSDPVLQQLFSVPTGPAYKKREQNLGSGVIVRGDGYVLTNNHVIANADDIQVLLYDGRVAKATLVGSDEETDLAVLKVDAANLPVMHIPDTPRKLRVGDVVLAIGNPFGIGQTVTMGIVSAIGRQLNLSSPENFIQTDAAINFGNSGGALVDAAGELVGINTALIGQAVGAEGIGFAIPVSSAKQVMDQIIATGHVVRGWLGADYSAISVSADSGLPSAARGVVVTDVYPGGPAAQGGIQPRDVLLRIGEADILDPNDLRRREAANRPGTVVTVSGLRAGAPFHTEVKLAQRSPVSMQAPATQPPGKFP
jgi:serine protease DegQ